MMGHEHIPDDSGSEQKKVSTVSEYQSKKSFLDTDSSTQFNQSDDTQGLQQWSDEIEQSEDIQELQEWSDNIDQSDDIQGLKKWSDDVDTFEQQQHRSKNNSNIPALLKQKLEQLSGISLSNVFIDFNSTKPSKKKGIMLVENNKLFVAPKHKKYFLYGLAILMEQLSSSQQSNALERDLIIKKLKLKPLERVLIESEATHNGYLLKKKKKVHQLSEKVLENEYPFFYKTPHDILVRWPNIPDETNSHGYSIKQTFNTWIEAEEVLDVMLPDAPIAIFIKNGQIAHSARYDSTSITHLLTDVGVIESTLGLTDTAEYDARFNLPDDREALETYLAEEAIKKMGSSTEYQQLTEIEEALRLADETHLDPHNLYDAFKKLTSLVAKVTFIEKHEEEINAIQQRM